MNDTHHTATDTPADTPDDTPDDMLRVDVPDPDGRRDRSGPGEAGPGPSHPDPAPAPQQLRLLDASDLPLQHRLDLATRQRGLAHVAELRRVLSAQVARAAERAA